MQSLEYNGGVFLSEFPVGLDRFEFDRSRAQTQTPRHSGTRQRPPRAGDALRVQ